MKALARAFRWRKMLDEGVHATLEDLARSKSVNATYVSRVLRLTLLAPEIVEAILDGRQPADLQLDDLLDGFPLEWEGQAECWATDLSLGKLKLPTFSQRLTTTFHIKLIYLPPYTPQLQPAEHLWPIVDEPVANRHFATLADLDAVQSQPGPGGGEIAEQQGDATVGYPGCRSVRAVIGRPASQSDGAANPCLGQAPLQGNRIPSVPRASARLQHPWRPPISFRRSPSLSRL